MRPLSGEPARTVPDLTNSDTVGAGEIKLSAVSRRQYFVKYVNSEVQGTDDEEIRTFAASDRRNVNNAFRSTAPRQPKRVKFLTEAQVEALVKAAGTHRDRTMIKLGYTHGLRVSELVSLRGIKSTSMQGRCGSIAPSTAAMPPIQSPGQRCAISGVSNVKGRAILCS